MPKGRLFLVTCGLAALISVSALANLPIPVEKPPAEDKKSPAPDLTQTLVEKRPIYRPAQTTKPLSRRSASLYKEVYNLQHQQKWEEADRILERIDNTILFGHVYAQRLYHPAYNAGAGELESWLAAYGDHPQAVKIARKINAKDKVTYKNRTAGTQEDLRYFANGSKYISEKYDGGQRYEIRLVKKEIKKYLDRGAATSALHFLEKHRVNKYIDPVDKSQILADIAATYLYQREVSKARKIALSATKLSAETPIAPWVMGLTAWIRNDFDESARYFTLASQAKYASPWMTAAAAYWGARASTRAGLYKDVSTLLTRAVKHQRTFYGLIATKALGYGYDFNWTMPDFTPSMQNIMQQYPAGARAMALIDIGQNTLAESELFALPVKTNPKLQEAAIAFANKHHLASYAMRHSLAIPNTAGGYYDAGLFPISSWTTHEGYRTDRALMNAFIRQESRFDTAAKNGTGATGLMQIMPDTAAFIASDKRYKDPDGPLLLMNPRTNVRIGDKYLDHLLDLDAVKGDLFALAIAYNAGPGKLRKWRREINVDDPLLFIELLPASETRAFVERVVTNYWIYQMQMGTEPESLTAVASGQWPKIR